MFSLGYRYRRDVLEQVDLSFLYPINDSWSAVVATTTRCSTTRRWKPSPACSRDSCCVAVRVAGEALRAQSRRRPEQRPHVRDRTEGAGIGRAGYPAGLRRSVLGYNRTTCSWCRRRPPRASPMPGHQTTPPMIHPLARTSRPLLPSSSRAARRNVQAADLRRDPASSSASPAVVNEDVILRTEPDHSVANIPPSTPARETMLPPAEVLERQCSNVLELARATDAGITGDRPGTRSAGVAQQTHGRRPAARGCRWHHPSPISATTSATNRHPEAAPEFRPGPHQRQRGEVDAPLATRRLPPASSSIWPTCWWPMP